MKIKQVNLMSFHLEEMKRFYTEVLEMDLVASTDTSFTVLAGETKLVFNKTKEMPFYHLCFRTSNDYFEHMFLKLDEVERLLEIGKGEKSMFWDGKQAYFNDPDGNILELLERPFLGDGEVPLTWFDVNEVGFPVTNVKEAQQFLSKYVNDVVKRDNDTFAFFGDRFGCLVIVKEGRHWYPTERGSSIHPLEMIVSGKEAANFSFNKYPYSIKVITEE